MKHAVDDLPVQLVPELWQRLLAAEDAVEGQDQRHGRGLLQAGPPRRSAQPEPGRVLGLSANQLPDDGFDIAGVAQRLEFADPVGLVRFLDVELVVP